MPSRRQGLHAPPPRPQPPWAVIRKRYEVDGDGCYVLAREFGINPKTVTSRVRRESWAARGSLGAATARLAIEKFLAQDAEAVARVLSSHFHIADKARRLVERELDALLERGTGKAPSLHARRWIESLKDIVEIQRQAAGLRDDHVATNPEETVGAIKFTFDEKGVEALEKHSERRLQLVKARDDAAANEPA